jgi:5-methylcytosine-specific restriction endonuclease McrA
MTPQPKPKPRYPHGRSSYRRRSASAWARQVTQTPEWASWRQQVFQRDGYRCVMCPNTPAAKLAFRASRRHLEPHHIQRKIDHPELVYEVDNGVTLCDHCHAKVTDHERDYEKRFQTYVRKLHEREAALHDMTGLECEI